MESGAKRRHIPHWPPFKQPYQQLGSAENVQLTPLPPTGGSSLPSANLFSPDLDGTTAYTPDPLASTPQPLLRSPSIYMVYEGSCTKTETRDTWVHLALNIVATVLLASSNYCMQLLSSPTRSEIDKAHAKQKWLDIGIPSMRNLASLRKKKVILWWLLGVSSIPLHLIVLYASNSFVQGASYDKNKFSDTEECNVTDIQARASKDFILLNNEDCIHAYARDFVEDRRNVIVVVKNPPANEGSLFKIAVNEFPPVINSSFNNFAWICDNPDVVNQTHACCENQWGFVPCSKITPKLVDIADQWSTGGFEVDHCLSEPVESQCHLHFSLILMGVVLVFNILKVIGIAYVTFWLGESPLVTVGDALQSFLRHPDSTTEGMCLASHSSIVASSKLGYRSMPMRYDPRQHRFFEAATWKQWAFLLGLFTFAGVGTAVCLALGIENLRGDRTIQDAWSIGLNTVKPQNLIMGWNLAGSGNTSIAIPTLIANAPQALFSFLYVCYNSLFTVMFLARELMRFSVTSGRGRKYLRVSEAKGEQKSTYFLNLPFKYGLPLLVGSGLLHWLVSQSVFLANIAIIPRDGTVPMQDEITTVAYSPIGMLFLLCLGFVLLVFLLATAVRKLPFGMPLIGSNSMAISAACHLPSGMDQSEREEMVLRPLNWGAVPGAGKVLDLGIHDPNAYGYESGDLDEDGTGFGHCCFSDRVLDPPVKGKFYI
ncbi:hypothetical protein AYO22_02836 [Fonsecaea multimorphosa]|nr:hypothetical protein AYO22_02836 [Fonsecaea multimorphosa]